MSPTTSSVSDNGANPATRAIGAPARAASTICRDTIYLMKEKHSPSHGLPASGLMERLAEFRYRLRAFVQFSEQAALNAGLQPQQHQLLLQIAGAPAGAIPTIAYA